MQVNIILNGTKVTAEAAPDTLLIDFVRAHGCYSVKRGCETSNCGLCTVFLDDVPVLSCSVLAARADGHRVTTLEGLQEEAAEFGAFIADQGAEQCGFLLQALQRGNAAAIHPRRQYRAGKHRLFVQKHGAQPAVGGFAPALDAFAA